MDYGILPQFGFFVVETLSEVLEGGDQRGFPNGFGINSAILV